MMQLTLGPHTMIHQHYKRKYNQSGMTLPAEFHSLSCSIVNTLSPREKCQLLTAQKSHTAAWSEAFPIANE